MKKATGLGRGLSALIDEAVRPVKDGVPAGAGVREIEVGRIRPNPLQPRKNFDDNALSELTASIAERGVLQPILVRTVDDGFEIIAGERRWRAAQKAQLHQIPAIVRDFDESATAEIALIENIQREDLNAIEEAEGYRQLINGSGMVKTALPSWSASRAAMLPTCFDYWDCPTASNKCCCEAISAWATRARS